MPQLDTSTFIHQLFWIIITFGLMWIFAQKYILPKFENILNNREARIAQNFSEAEELNKEAKSVVEDYNSAMEKARADANSILHELNAELNADAQKQLDQLNAKLEEKVLVAEREIEAKRQEAMAELRVLAVEVTQDVISKVSDTQIDGALIKQSVERALDVRGVN